MIKTCNNCKNFVATITTLHDGKEVYHDHQYCSAWGTTIPYHIYLDDTLDTIDVLWDDIECGIAKCWLFEPADAPYDEEEMRNRCLSNYGGNSVLLNKQEIYNENN